MNKSSLILLFIFMAFFWIFFLPGPRVATDYYFSSYEIIKDNTFPWVWRENAADGLGEYVVGTLWSQPIHIFFRGLSEFNISVIWVTKIFLALTLFTGSFSIIKLLSYLKITGFTKYVGALFYLSNSFFLLLLDGGQLSLALVYALTPLCFYSYLKVTNNGNIKNRLFLISCLLLISFLDLRYILLLFLLFLINFFFKIFLSPRKENLFLIKNLFITGLVSGLVLLLAHSYWLIPSVLSRSFDLPQTYERAAQIDFLSWSTLSHSIFLQQPHWYKNIFGNISTVSIAFSLIPILALLAVILKRKSRVVGFWLIVAFIGIFLSKGSQDPFGYIYTWLFTHIPGFSLFRDPVKFYLYIALSYTILISISLTKISEFNFTNRFLNKLIKHFPHLIFIYLILLTHPVYLGQMTGMFSEPRYEREYLDQRDIFAKDLAFSRIFWIPTQNPLGYSSLNHPAVSAARLVQKRPFAIGVKGTYETFNFLREAPFMGQIFDVAGIGYIDYPYLDPKRNNIGSDNIKYFYIFLNQLSKLPWLARIADSKIPLLRVSQHQGKFFVTSNIWWVVGSDYIYNEATKSANLRLAANALIFAEEHVGLGARISELPQVKIVLNKKSNVDLSATFIKPQDLIFPAKKLNFEPNESGWWKKEAADLINWRAFLQTKYGIDNQDFDLGGGWAVAEGERTYKISDIKYKRGNILLARVMESSKGGSLKFYQDDQLIGEIVTKKIDDTNVRWFEVGELSDENRDLSIGSVGEINVVNAIAVLGKNDWRMFKDKATQLEAKIVDFNEINASNSVSVQVNFDRINPTKYIVNIKGLTQSSLLIFSQNYDSLWKIDGKIPFPVYSLLNGFRIDRDGQYVVGFEAQKYVIPGLIVSFLTLVVLVFLVIKYNRSR